MHYEILGEYYRTSFSIRLVIGAFAIGMLTLTSIGRRNELLKSPDAPKGDRAVFAGDCRKWIRFYCRADRNDPKTGTLVEGGIEAQTEQVLKNLEAVLKASGSGLDDVVKTTVFLADMNDFAKMNEIYAKRFKTPFPARSTVQVARLPRDAKIEIEVIAVVRTASDSDRVK